MNREEVITDKQILGIDVKPCIIIDLLNIVSSKRKAEFPIDVKDVVFNKSIIANLRSLSKDYLIFAYCDIKSVADGSVSSLEINMVVDYIGERLKPLLSHMHVNYHDIDCGRDSVLAKRSLCARPNIGFMALVESLAWDEGHIMLDWDMSIVIASDRTDVTWAKNAGCTPCSIELLIDGTISKIDTLINKLKDGEKIHYKNGNESGTLWSCTWEANEGEKDSYVCYQTYGGSDSNTLAEALRKICDGFHSIRETELRP